MPLRRRAAAALALASASLLAGLHAPVRATDPAPLRVNQLQARGTHNSTHRDHNGTLQGVPDWDYDHRPLVEQLEDQDVRQIELDVHYNWAKDVFEVYHVWFGDDRATCDLLETCLRQVRAWSDAHPNHLPILVMIEPKDAQLEDEDPFTSPIGLAELGKLDAELASVWGDRSLTPDDVTQPGLTLRQSILTAGWPALSSARQQVIFLLDGDEHGDIYSDDGRTLAGRMMFVQPQESADVAAFVARSGSGNKYDRMARVVRDGFMVRDLIGGATPEGRKAAADAALAAGAHYISTDHPTELRLSGQPGVPARCNVVSAPPVCADADVETDADGHLADGQTATPDGYDRVAIDKADRLVVNTAESAVAAVLGQRTPPTTSAPTARAARSERSTES